MGHRSLLLNASYRVTLFFVIVLAIAGIASYFDISAKNVIYGLLCSYIPTLLNLLAFYFLVAKNTDKRKITYNSILKYIVTFALLLFFSRNLVDNHMIFTISFIVFVVVFSFITIKFNRYKQ